MCSKSFCFSRNRRLWYSSYRVYGLWYSCFGFTKGGALDFIDPGKNGMFFENATQSSLQECIDRFEKIKFNRQNIKIFSEKFCQDRFVEEFKQQVSNTLGASSEI